MEDLKTDEPQAASRKLLILLPDGEAMGSKHRLKVGEMTLSRSSFARGYIWPKVKKEEEQLFAEQFEGLYPDIKSDLARAFGKSNLQVYGPDSLKYYDR